MEERIRIAPAACFSHDEKEGHLRIDVELPGTEKKDITLEMRRDSFCVSAPREDSEYGGCFMLAHEVIPEKAEAKFENGLLRILAPIKDWENKVSVTIG